jgi:hypothetical protein
MTDGSILDPIVVNDSAKLVILDGLIESQYGSTYGNSVIDSTST